MASFVVMGYPSTARAPRCLAKSTVARASADAMPRLRKPVLVAMEVVYLLQVEGHVLPQGPLEGSSVPVLDVGTRNAGLLKVDGNSTGPVV
jgi:hypothetical protein